MEEKITQEELEFMQCWYTPECMAECLFSDVDNLTLFDEDKFSEVRMGQHPLLSHECMLAEDPKLTKKQNMALKEGAGNIVCLAARNWGKTCLEKMDILISLLCYDNTPLIVTSYDSIHVRGVLNPVLDSLTFHPIISLFKKRIQRSPAYLVTTENGNTLDGVNANVKDGQNAGKQFFQKHAKKLWGEEASKETEAVYYKRVASRHALGCVERLTGMSDFSQHSVSGKRYYEAKKHNQAMNLPSYINPDWGEKDKQKEIKKYSGEKSIGFRMYVKGEIVTDKISALDMTQVRDNCYPHLKNGFIDESKNIKEFEISKKNIDSFKNVIIVERPVSSERMWLSIDVGRGGGQSEIMIFSEVNNRFHYLYNITLYNLMDKPQFEIIAYLIKQLSLDFISIDAGEGTGVAIYGRVEEIFPKENLTWYDGSKKVIIGFQKNTKGDLVLENGKPVARELTMSEWSVQHLKELMYNGKFYFPFSYKLDEQLSNVVQMNGTNKVIFSSIKADDHLWDSIRVHSIGHWLHSNNFTKPKSRTPSIGVIDSI